MIKKIRLAALAPVLLLSGLLSSSLLFSQSIVVGSENAYKPFAYVDSNNQPTGFDNEVVQVVASYIPDADLQIVPVPWNVIFTGLDSGKFNVVANQITKTPTRVTKYIFSSKPYFYSVSGLIVSGKDSDIKDIKDLSDVKIGVTVGSNHAANLDKYVKDNPKQKIKVIYYKTSPSLVKDLASGRIKAMINDPVSALDQAKSQNIDLSVTDFYFEKVPVYFVFRKDSKELMQAFDEALDKAIQDGRISEISMKYFGIDQTK